MLLLRAGLRCGHLLPATDVASGLHLSLLLILFLVAAVRGSVHCFVSHRSIGAKPICHLLLYVTSRCSNLFLLFFTSFHICELFQSPWLTFQSLWLVSDFVFLFPVSLRGHRHERIGEPSNRNIIRGSLGELSFHTIVISMLQSLPYFNHRCHLCLI